METLKSLSLGLFPSDFFLPQHFYSFIKIKLTYSKLPATFKVNNLIVFTYVYTCKPLSQDNDITHLSFLLLLCTSFPLLATTNLPLVTVQQMSLHSVEFYLSSILLYILWSFCFCFVWQFQFCIIVLRFICYHICKQFIPFCWYSIMWICHNLFIHLTFQFLPIVSKAAMIFVYKFLYGHIP